MDTFHGLWDDDTIFREEMGWEEPTSAPSDMIVSTQPMFSEDSSGDHGFYHQFFNRDLFAEMKKGKAMEALEDVVESFLGDLFHKREVVYPSDVVVGLDLEYEIVEKIFAKFVRQDKLKD